MRTVKSTSWNRRDERVRISPLVWTFPPSTEHSSTGRAPALVPGLKPCSSRRQSVTVRVSRIVGEPVAWVWPWARKMRFSLSGRSRVRAVLMVFRGDEAAQPITASFPAAASM